MSHTMRQQLSRSNYVFSGLKTFHELNEAFPSLLDENGNRKTFERFLKDVQKIHETYNRNYLRAEYNFVHASAAMAARWEEFARDGDDYLLQYRTAGDGKVRPEHAALNGVTLPPSDTFWDEYYPPNGWNCRCTAVQVRKGKNTTPDRVYHEWSQGNLESTTQVRQSQERSTSEYFVAIAKRHTRVGKSGRQGKSHGKKVPLHQDRRCRKIFFCGYQGTYRWQVPVLFYCG